MTAILISVLVSLAVNGAFFAVAASHRTDVVTDLSYSLTFAVLAVALPFTGARAASQLVASVLVLLWALRLGAYLFRRIRRIKVDHRFDGMRDRPLRFARFWLLQAIAVAVIMLLHRVRRSPRTAAAACCPRRDAASLLVGIA